MTKREQFEQHKKSFLQIKGYFESTGEDFALAKAYKSLGNGTESTQQAKQ